MDDTGKGYKIAAASSDGIVVNQHFGHANAFLIYEVKDSEIRRTDEIRTVHPICSGGNHNDEQLIENIRRFQDCKYILVSKIGMRAAAQAEQLGITPMELPGLIEESIRRVMAFEQIQNLFERN
ncbi:MAG: dinitrogenase iron-molybdenum cofactor biosynthesis protein [Ruminococcus sp.]|nr:dinitrogenase iron-molybdenum cofactor biosynthesis protein [Ruminococcus sp.]